MLNLIVLMGRATKDPELRKVNDTSVLNLDLAVDDIRTNSQGEKTTSFFKVTCFGKVAENSSKYVRKGSKIAVTGSIEQRTFLVQDGSKRSTYDVIADSVEFLDPKPAEPAEVVNEELPFDKEEVEVAPEEPKEQLFDPYTGKPLKSKAKK